MKRQFSNFIKLPVPSNRSWQQFREHLLIEGPAEVVRRTHTLFVDSLSFASLLRPCEPSESRIPCFDQALVGVDCQVLLIEAARLYTGQQGLCFSQRL